MFLSLQTSGAGRFHRLDWPRASRRGAWPCLRFPPVFGQLRPAKCQKLFKAGAFAAVSIAMQQCQAQKDPLFMAQPAQIGTGGIFKANLCTEIRMGAPAHIMEQTSGPHQPSATIGSLEKSGEMNLCNRIPKPGSRASLRSAKWQLSIKGSRSRIACGICS